MLAHTFSADVKLDQSLYECCCICMVSACIATTAAAEGAIVPAPELQVLLICQTGVNHMQNGTKQEQLQETEVTVKILTSI